MSNKIEYEGLRGQFEEAYKDDSWKHRTQNMICFTCIYFVPKTITTLGPQAIIREAESKLGRCRRHAPTTNGFPVVFQDDWCGDHKLSENKI